MNIRFRQRISLLMAPLILLGLAACGGSGGSGSGVGQNPSTASFSLDTPSLSFSANSYFATPLSQDIIGTATGLSSGNLYIRIEIAGNAVSTISPIVFLNNTTGKATVVPANATNLGAGTFTSTLTVYACTSDITCQSGQLRGSPQQVTVTYNIAGVASSPSSLKYSLTNSSLSADKIQQLTISGYPNQSWTAQSDHAWLTLSSSGGDTTTSSTLTVSVDETSGKLLNGTYSAYVTLTPTTGAPIAVPVTVSVDRTELDFVSPAVAVSTESHEVIIHGAHLDVAGLSGIRFGDQKVTPITVVANNEIRVTPPMLAAGTYPVTLDGTTEVALAASQANLTVVDPAAYTAKALTNAVFYYLRGGEPSKIIYDAKRKKLYVLSFPTPDARGDFNMYSYLSTNNWDATLMGVDVNKIYSMAMSTDGDWLLQGVKTDGFDPALTYTPLDATGTGSGSDQQLTDATTEMKSIAVASDGQAVIVTASEAGGNFRPAWTAPSRLTGQLFAWDKPILSMLSVPNSSDSSAFYDGVVGSSLDGSRVLLASSTSAPGTPHMYEYDPLHGQLVDTGQTLKADSIQLDRTGSRVLINGMDLYNGSFSLLGHLASTTVSATLTPDGSKIYTYDSSGHIKRVNATTLVEEADWIPVASAGDTIKRIVMTTSPDGGTLFIAGTDAVLIEPVQ